MIVRRERHLRVVLFSDVVGSSEKIFADELIAIQHIKSDLSFIKEALKRHGGSLVKSLGDGLLATFEAPSQALEFVQDVVTDLHHRSGSSLEHRFGIHVGEIFVDGDDILGQGVHLASRLQTIAPPNGVAFVRSTYEMVQEDFRQRATPMGEVTLAGLPEPVVCFCIDQERLVHAPLTPGEAMGGLMITSPLPRSSRPWAVEDLLAGSPFRLERAIGRSETQLTFLVRDRQRDRQAVLKVFPGPPDIVDAVAVESACLDRLRHPAIPRFLDGFEREGCYCLLQEWIPGPSLHGSLDYLRKHQRLSQLLRQVLEVLVPVHQAGIIHGDIHPANLIPSTDSSQLFVVDFSLVKSRSVRDMAASTPPAETLVGHSSDPISEAVSARAFYSPPERARFGRLWPGIDLYALGVAALRLYTGRHPAQLYDQTAGGWDVSSLDPEMERWLRPLLEESPGRRVQSAADALQLLDRPMSAACGDAWITRGAAPALGRVGKQSLQRALVETYGPVVELLLESVPTLIPADQVPLLTRRLVEAGLQPEDITAALETATVRPDPLAGEGTVEPDDPFSGNRSALIAVLSRSIGPVAELLLSPDVVGHLLKDDASAAAVLTDLSLPSDAQEDLAAEARRLRGRADEGRGDERLLSALLETVGPMGERIYREVLATPSERRLEEAVARLECFFIDPVLIKALRDRYTSP